MTTTLEPELASPITAPATRRTSFTLLLTSRKKVLTSIIVTPLYIVPWAGVKKPSFAARPVRCQ